MNISVKLKHIFLWFTIYSFIGWSWELIYRSIVEGHIFVPGFLNGPICPIYGFVSVLFILLLDKFKDKWYIVFALGALIAGAFEYLTSYILETMFHAVWWDYSGFLFNIKGRICLEAMIFFGLLAMLLVNVVHPFIIKCINNYLTEKSLTIVDITIICILVMDISVTLFRMLALNEYSVGTEIIYPSTII